MLSLRGVRTTLSASILIAVLGMGIAFCNQAFGGATIRNTSAQAMSSSYQVWGYYPWWMRDDWLDRDISIYDRLLFFQIEVGEDGHLSEHHGWPQDWRLLQKAVGTREGKMDIALTLFSAERFERIFSNPGKRKLLLTELLVLAQHAQGVHLDFEIFSAISMEAANGLRGFISEVRNALRALDSRMRLSVFGVMGAATTLYDGAALDDIDYVVVQGYDHHHAASKQAGPVAALRGPYAITWESALRHYLALGVPREKIIFGVPLYGYEWPTESAAVGSATRGLAKEITHAAVDARLLPGIRTNAQAQVAAHGLKRDDASGSPYYLYSDPSGAWYQGWFEDVVSLAEKFAFVKRERLAGIAIFPVGYDQGAFDALLRQAFKETRVDSGAGLGQRWRTPMPR